MYQRLRGVLEMRRHAPDGREHGAEAYIFGDATGSRVRSVKTAWENARLKAHGCDPLREDNGRLTPECRAKLRTIDLRFHDLRREAGSRFLEAGMAANYVQRFLDHANLSTTSRYLKVERQGMHAALRSIDDRRCQSLAKSDGPRLPASNANGSTSGSKSIQ